MRSALCVMLKAMPAIAPIEDLRAAQEELLAAKDRED